MVMYMLARKNDIEELVRMRMEYIQEDQGKISVENEKMMKAQLPMYFEKHLGKDIMAFIAKDGERIVSTVLLHIIEKPSNPHFIHGRIGEVLNVYTVGVYQKKGIATTLMQQMIEFVKNYEFDFVQLSATKDGYSLYKKLGFYETKSGYIEMKYKC